MNHQGLAARLASIVALTALAACASTNFTKTGDGTSRAALPKGCAVVVFQETPADRESVELGFCDVAVPGGGIIRDNMPKAIQTLKDCACGSGGNAIVLRSDSEQGVVGIGYSQQRVKARATVLWISQK